jgi:hypothetical protein
LLELPKLGVRGMPKGPAKNCFPCCGLRRDKPNWLNADGTPWKSQMTATFDGWFKAMIRLGNKVDLRDAFIREFVNKVNDVVQAAEVAGAPQEREAPHACDSHFRCANASLQLHADVLLNVVIGGFCAHYLPLVDLFVLSRRGGAFSAHGAGLGSALTPLLLQKRTGPSAQASST